MKRLNHILMIKMIAILSLFIMTFGSQANAREAYNQYCNARFSFCVNYPADLIKGPAPQNNDGREFHSHDGFSMTASGMYNALNSTLREEMQDQKSAFDKITYQRAKKNWYVLSGYQGNDILYLKTYVTRDIIYHLYIKYPAELNKKYSPKVGKISHSFKPPSR